LKDILTCPALAGLLTGKNCSETNPARKAGQGLASLLTSYKFREDKQTRKAAFLQRKLQRKTWRVEIHLLSLSKEDILIAANLYIYV
jgi:hypothetical protein